MTSFLPSSIEHLTEPDSIRLVRSIQRTAISTTLSPAAIQTAYVQQGEGGTPIVLLHGFDSSLLEFRHLIPLLASRNETWAVDLLGFGFSDRPQNLLFSPQAIKTHLREFWKTTLQRPVILVGASMGGATAIDFALTYPEIVEKLVLIDSLGYTAAPAFVKFLFPPLDYLAVEYLRQRKLKALEISLAMQADPAVIDLLRCSVLHTEMANWHESMIAFTKSGGYHFLANQIREIKQPTLILWGEADDILGTADAKRFHQDIPHSQLVWIKNSKHVPQIEQPQFVAEQILAFSV